MSNQYQHIVDENKKLMQIINFLGPQKKKLQQQKKHQLQRINMLESQIEELNQQHAQQIDQKDNQFTQLISQFKQLELNAQKQQNTLKDLIIDHHFYISNRFLREDRRITRAQLKRRYHQLVQEGDKQTYKLRKGLIDFSFSREQNESLQAKQAQNVNSLYYIQKKPDSSMQQEENSSKDYQPNEYEKIIKQQNKQIYNGEYLNHSESFRKIKKQIDEINNPIEFYNFSIEKAQNSIQNEVEQKSHQIRKDQFFFNQRNKYLEPNQNIQIKKKQEEKILIKRNRIQQPIMQNQIVQNHQYSRINDQIDEQITFGSNIDSNHNTQLNIHIQSNIQPNIQPNNQISIEGLPELRKSQYLILNLENNNQALNNICEDDNFNIKQLLQTLQYQFNRSMYYQQDFKTQAVPQFRLNQHQIRQQAIHFSRLTKDILFLQQDSETINGRKQTYFVLQFPEVYIKKCKNKNLGLQFKDVEQIQQCHQQNQTLMPLSAFQSIFRHYLNDTQQFKNYFIRKIFIDAKVSIQMMKKLCKQSYPSLKELHLYDISYSNDQWQNNPKEQIKQKIGLVSSQAFPSLLCLDVHIECLWVQLMQFMLKQIQQVFLFIAQINIHLKYIPIQVSKQLKEWRLDNNNLTNIKILSNEVPIMYYDRQQTYTFKVQNNQNLQQIIRGSSQQIRQIINQKCMMNKIVCQHIYGINYLYPTYVEYQQHIQDYYKYLYKNLTNEIKNDQKSRKIRLDKKQQKRVYKILQKQTKNLNQQIIEDQIHQLQHQYMQNQLQQEICSQQNNYQRQQDISEGTSEDQIQSQIQDQIQDQIIYKLKLKNQVSFIKIHYNNNRKIDKLNIKDFNITQSGYQHYSINRLTFIKQKQFENVQQIIYHTFYLEYSQIQQLMYLKKQTKRKIILYCYNVLQQTFKKLSHNKLDIQNVQFLIYKEIYREDDQLIWRFSPSKRKFIFSNPSNQKFVITNQQIKDKQQLIKQFTLSKKMKYFRQNGKIIHFGIRFNSSMTSQDFVRFFKFQWLEIKQLYISSVQLGKDCAMIESNYYKILNLETLLLKSKKITKVLFNDLSKFKHLKQIHVAKNIKYLKDK